MIIDFEVNITYFISHMNLLCEVKSIVNMSIKLHYFIPYHFIYGVIDFIGYTNIFSNDLKSIV